LRHRFETTRWSVVRAAGGEHSSAARRALAELCETYWYPLYAYVRRQGHDADEAQDLTQSFFVLLLERHDVQGLDRSRGRFRAFLLASLRHFLLNEAVRRQALKRGGGRELLPLEFEVAEERYAREPADIQTPETIFERRWALTLFDRVLQGLRSDWDAAGKGPEFNALKLSLMGELPAGHYELLATERGWTVNATRVAVHRLRRRFRQRLREAIADTVLSDEAVDDEIRHLFKALRG
jgi:DNA-directed RNA polymerase specialized sigma24 family protein